MGLPRFHGVVIAIPKFGLQLIQYFFMDNLMQFRKAKRVQQIRFQRRRISKMILCLHLEIRYPKTVPANTMEKAFDGLGNGFNIRITRIIIYIDFRFPCCGKLYPCDSCHADNEKDHEMKLANRMVCGFCSAEQPLSNESCKHCKGLVIKLKTSFWEGGKGCRNQMAMSK